MHRPPGSPRHWPRHAIMIVVSFLMLIPFYWVLKTSLTGENIYAWPPRIVPVDPHLFNYVDVWYMIPFARYLLNSVIVTAMAHAGSLLLNVAAGYSLRCRPRQVVDSEPLAKMRSRLRSVTFADSVCRLTASLIFPVTSR